jgi:DNA-binding NarL/FixJ family response regulator
VTRTFSLVVADDHPLFLEAVARLFEREQDFVVTKRCRDGAAVLASVREHRPDLLVTDLRMPGLGGIEVLRTIAQELLDVPTVLLTAEISENELLDALRLGVKGVVLKDMVPELLVRCARTVLAGESWLERNITGRALQRLLTHETARKRVETMLTARELELVNLVSEGLRNKQIAARLDITENTVKVHLHRIYEKLGVTTRVELANYIRNQNS